MSSGTRSILLTRWRTGGRTNFDLVREFAKESADAPAAEAWQRACLLARENPIDLGHEPRLKRAEETGDMPKADHPFFWAGYLLVDTGPGRRSLTTRTLPKTVLTRTRRFRRQQSRAMPVTNCRRRRPKRNRPPTRNRKTRRRMQRTRGNNIESCDNEISDSTSPVCADPHTR